MSIEGARKQITGVVLKWAGVTAQPHRFNGRAFHLGKREIGHIHGDHLLDIPFPTKVGQAVVAAGRAQPHHVLPQSGWVSFYIREEADIKGAIELLRQSYELARKQRSKQSKESTTLSGGNK